MLEINGPNAAGHRVIETANDNQTDSASNQLLSHWRTFAHISCANCLIAFLGTLAVKFLSTDQTLSIAVTSVLVGQATLSGIFAALGPQSYFERLLLSQFFLAAVSFSFFGGLAIAYGIGDDSPVAFAFVVFSLAASHAPQFVFGLFRVFGGWQLHKDDSDRGPTYAVQDLLTLTLFIAISLSLLDQMFRVFETDRGANAFAYLYMSLGIAIGTLVYAVPTFVAVFRTNTFESGCTAQIIVVFTLLFFVVVPTLALGTGMGTAGAIGTLICGCCLATWLPLAILREKGFVLTRGKGTRRVKTETVESPIASSYYTEE